MSLTKSDWAFIIFVVAVIVAAFAWWVFNVVLADAG